MFSKGKERILVLGPHTDDGELGCGGTIAKRACLGHQILYVVFSSCQTSVPKGHDGNILKREVKDAVVSLGLDPEKDLLLYDFDVRHFPENRQKILEKMIELRMDYKPDVVFCPSLNDIHQDHQTVAHEALRAFKKQSILCYEEPWNNISFSTNAFERLDEEHLQKKIDALAAYKSQAKRSYFQGDMIRSLAVTRGGQLEGGYAEAFEVVRWML